MSQDQTDTAQSFDDLIIIIAQNKDRSAFIQLFEQVSPRLKAYAMRCGASATDAEEVVQEALLTVWRKAHTFNPKTASAITWLYTIVRNKRIDLVRKERPDLITSDDLWPETYTDNEHLENEVESDLNVNIVRTLLHGLPETQRQIVYKVYFEGKPHSEIANELDLPLGTIKSRLRLAMKKLDTLAKEQMTWLIIILLTNF
ncbi:sigma-70 family RNA polymerase sigma factor [Alkalimarinus sediminis]|uniref:RNA polymerase sigma factor n=1 Tax=Alkalimarinus sediminis TaxID=1632866 RepID=A0A9E8KR59_9ALTE|nr:sigma-70 family RNA polymerase sigma factor [Alkalimarinus sediminis]UZW75950.1 sigma-70 family RNA polymerase sigma factor [Alkalimarinus sediminis]